MNLIRFSPLDSGTMKFLRCGEQPAIFLIIVFALLVWVPQPSIALERWEPVGPDGATVLALERDPHAEGRLLAGTYFGGIFESLDDGENWHHLRGPFSRSVVQTIAFDQSAPGVIYAGTFEDGIYKSLDNGSTWNAINFGLSDLIINDIVIDPGNPSVLLAATLSGIFRSDDGGDSWTFAAGEGLASRALAFHPSVPGLVYAALLDDRGAYRSTDSGASWQPFNAGLGAHDLVSLRFDAQTGTKLYATSSLARAYRLNPGASTWTNITANLPSELVSDILPHPLDNTVLYAATDDGIYISIDDGGDWLRMKEMRFEKPRLLLSSATGDRIMAGTLRGAGLFLSTDYGDTWNAANKGIQNLFIGGLSSVAVPGGTRMHVGSFGAFTSADGGASWLSSLPRRDINDIQPHPVFPDLVYAGTLLGGMWTSVDGGGNWYRSDQGITPWKIHDIAQFPSAPYTLYAATSWGFFVSDDHGANWRSEFLPTSLPGDIFAVAVDPEQEGVAYFASSGLLYKTIDAGKTGKGTFFLPTGGLPEFTTFVQLRVTALSDGSRRLFGLTRGGDLYVSVDEGLNWSALLIGAEVTRFDVNASATLIYLATPIGVRRSADGGASWEDSSTGLPASLVNTVVIDPLNNARLLAGTADGLFQSVDAGEHWISAAASLPTGNVTAINVRRYTGAPTIVKLAGEGIYRSNDNGASWVATGGLGLPNDEGPLLIHVAAPQLFYTGTQGKGIYASLDSGGNWLSTSNGMALWMRRLAIAPEAIYAAALQDGLFKSTDFGASWENIGLHDQILTDVIVDPVDANTVYAASTKGMWKSVDGGVNWINAEPTLFFMSFAVNPVATNIVYAGTEGNGLLKSVDGGLNWAAISNGFLDNSAYAMAVDPTRPDRVYAGSVFTGVYVSEDAGDSWGQLGAGSMFNTFVLDIVLDAADPDVIFAGTEGGGVFRLRRESSP